MQSYLLGYNKKESNLFSGHRVTLLGLKKSVDISSQREVDGKVRLRQILSCLQGNEYMFKNNHAVNTVDKALVLHYHNSKANLSVIFKNASKTYLVILYCYL